MVLVFGKVVPDGVTAEGAPLQGHIISFQPVVVPFELNSKQLVDVLYTISPIAGLDMAAICAEVIRGVSSPSVVEVMSIMAEAFGEFVPMPTCPETIILVPAGAVLTPA